MAVNGCKSEGGWCFFTLFYWCFAFFPFVEMFYISIIWYICIEICRYEAKVKRIKKGDDMAKVIHVHLLQQIDGVKRRDWYFSSLSAVFTVFTPEQVGVTKNYLLHAGLSGGGVIINKRAVIRQSTLIGCRREGDG